MCSIASPTPSTSFAEMIASRYSVVQSASVAATAFGNTARTSSVARISQPALASASRIGTRCVAATARSTSSVSADAADAGAPHLGVDGDRHRHVELGRAVDIDDGRCLRDARTPARALPSARARPGSCRRAARSRRDCRTAPSASRRRRRGRWSAPAGSHRSGSSAAFSPSTRQAWIACEEFSESEPPRRITGLPALRQSAPASAVTFGPALIDDADHAERRAHALDMQAVRPVPFGDHLADRIAQVRRWHARRRPCRGCGPASASGGP